MLQLLSGCLAVAFAGVLGTSSGPVSSEDPLPGQGGAWPLLEAPTDQTSEDPAAGGSFERLLGEAKQLYFQGESDKARDLLQGLQLRLYAGENVPWPLIVEALTYLGEIYYAQSNQEQAKIVFRYLLERDPETPISPFHHTIEVVNLFELVRTQVKAEQSGPPKPVPAPVTTYLPLGIPQFAQGRTGSGLVYGGLQAGLGLTSVLAYVSIDRFNQDPNQDPKKGVPRPDLVDADARGRVTDRLRYQAQWPATIGFYTMWAVSTIDAARWHQRHLGRQREVTILPGPGAGLAVHGRF